MGTRKNRLGEAVLTCTHNLCCGYSLEPPRRGGSNVYPQSMFRAKIRKILKIFFTSLHIAWASFRNAENTGHFVQIVTHMSKK